MLSQLSGLLLSHNISYSFTSLPTGPSTRSITLAVLSTINWMSAFVTMYAGASTVRSPFTPSATPPPGMSEMLNSFCKPVAWMVGPILSATGKGCLVARSFTNSIWEGDVSVQDIKW